MIESSRPSLVVTKIVQTCPASPSQWEGTTEDGRPLYIRYRFGFLSISVGPVGGDMNSAVNGEQWFGEEIGEGMDGYITLAEVCRHTGMIVTPKK